ncbi:hypothetical protein Tco_0199483 [Tanacetum coccineum]
MIRVTTTSLRGEVAASNHERKKSFPSWKQQEVGQKQNFKKGGFRNQQRSERKQDMFTLLTKTPKEILALDKGKFKPPSPMTTPIEKGTPANYERLGKGSKEGGSLRKGQTVGNPDGTTMAEGSQAKDYQTFSPESVISFPPLGEKDGTEGPMIIEAKMGGHFVHLIYVDGGSSLEIMYEHYFNRFRPEVRSQMVPAATPLAGFSGEIIWPLGQILLLVKIGDEEHSTLAWMNFMVVRSPSPYNGILRRPRVRRI